METSYKKAFRFVEVARAYIASVEEQDTKFIAALTSVADQIDEQREAYGKKILKIQRKFAAEDKFGCILRDDKGNYRYKKDQEEAMEERIEELFEHPDSIVYDPDFVRSKSIPEKLPVYVRKTFTGFVIEPEKEVEAKEEYVESNLKIAE